MRGHRILGGGVDCPSGAQWRAPIDKLRTLCRARKPAAATPRRAGAVARVTNPTFAEEGGLTGRDSTNYIRICQCIILVKV